MQVHSIYLTNITRVILRFNRIIVCDLLDIIAVQKRKVACKVRRLLKKGSMVAVARASGLVTISEQS